MQIAKNTTIITKNDIKKVQYISLLKSSWIIAIFAVVFVLLAFRVVDGKFVFESVFFAVLGAVSIPLYFAVVILLMNKQNKKLPAKTVYDYQITDNELSASANDGAHNETLTVKLDKILKFSQSKKYITIFVDKNTSLILDKNGFENDDQVAKTINLLNLKTKKPSKKAKK